MIYFRECFIGKVGKVLGMYCRDVVQCSQGFEVDEKLLKYVKKKVDVGLCLYL